jgi:hypothetical protein
MGSPSTMSISVDEIGVVGSNQKEKGFETERINHISGIQSAYDIFDSFLKSTLKTNKINKNVTKSAPVGDIKYLSLFPRLKKYNNYIYLIKIDRIDKIQDIPGNLFVIII